MNVDNELMDYGAAESLAEELPWWGWLEDGRSCLTRAGELLSIGAGDAQRPGRADARTTGPGGGPLATDVERCGFADPALLLFAAPTDPIRGRAGWRGIGRGRAWPPQAASVP